MKHSNHTLRYIDLHPSPVKREPSTLKIWTLAALNVIGLWLILSFCFSL